jgi:transcriptional regulator with XRE-family HTH domain
MSDDREVRPVAILASDAERERTIALLRDAVGEGRLTLEEFSERVGLAQAARTVQELAQLARDLPGAPSAASRLTAASASSERISRSAGHDSTDLSRNPGTRGRATKQALVKTLDPLDARSRRAELVGARIRLARRANGLSRAQLAKLLDATNEHVSRWELGHHEPNAFNLQRLSEALEMPLWFFFGGPPTGD